MPAKSEAQRRYLNAHFGHQWTREHHFDNKGKLPEHVGEKTVKQPGGHMKGIGAKKPKKKGHKKAKRGRDPDASREHQEMNAKHGCSIAGY